MSEQRQGGGGRRAAGVGVVAVIIALLLGPGRGLGLGAGSGMGTGTGTGTESQAVTAESTAAESTAESTAAESTAVESTAETKAELIVRVHNMEVYVDGTLCETDEAILQAVEENLKDGMVLILQDDYADNEAFTTVEKLLGDASYDYRTETKK